MTYKNIVFLVLFLTSFFCTSQTVREESPPKAQNVILLIGDGTGLSQISSAFFF